jgi:hypothetical protein
MPDDASAPNSEVQTPGKGFRILRFAAICLAGVLGWILYVSSFSLEARTERTQRLLHTRVFFRFELSDATFQESLDTLRRALNDAGIDERMVRIRVMDSAVRTGGKMIDGKASISLKSIPPMEAAMYCAYLFDLDCTVHGKELRIHPPGERPLHKRTFQLNPGFVTARLALKPDGTYDAEEFLRSQGISLQKDAWAKVDPKTNELEVFLTQSQIDLILTLSGCYGGPQTWKEKILDWFGLWP